MKRLCDERRQLQVADASCNVIFAETVYGAGGEHLDELTIFAGESISAVVASFCEQHGIGLHQCDTIVERVCVSTTHCEQVFSRPIVSEEGQVHGTLQLYRYWCEHWSAHRT